MNNLSVLICALALCLASTAVSAEEHAVSPVRISFANPVLQVKDLDASVKFYSEIMGYEIVESGEIEADVSKRTVGATRDQVTRSVYMRSAELQDRDLPPSGIALIYIEDDTLPQMERGADPEDAVQGEIMLSLVVEGLDELIARMKAAGHTVLNDPQPSASGKSRIASAVDPSGIRLEMYEYVE